MAEFTLYSPDAFSGIPLESDPVIFTDLLHALGVPSLQFCDVLSLDSADVAPGGPLALSTPVYALVLVYNTTREYEAGQRRERQEARNAGRGYAGYGDGEPAIWFEQTIRHACGFYGLLHAVANLSPAGHDFIEPDSLLAALLREAVPLAPAARALLLKNSAGIAQVYNGAATRGSSPLLHAEDEVPGHYTCFVRSPRNGHIYELDGGKNGPVDHDAVLDGDCDILSGGLKLVRELVSSRLDPANPHFHVMALVPTTPSDDCGF